MGQGVQNEEMSQHVVSLCWEFNFFLGQMLLHTVHSSVCFPTSCFLDTVRARVCVFATCQPVALLSSAAPLWLLKGKTALAVSDRDAAGRSPGDRLGGNNPNKVA